MTSVLPAVLTYALCTVAFSCTQNVGCIWLQHMDSAAKKHRRNANKTIVRTYSAEWDYVNFSSSRGCTMNLIL